MNAIDALFDFARDLFKPDRLSLICGGAFGLASTHYTLIFLNQGSQPQTAGAMNLFLAIALVIASSSLVGLIFNPSFGAVLTDFLKQSQGATGLGGMIRATAVAGLLIAIASATMLVWSFDWYTTSNGLGTTAFPLVDIRQAPAILCVFGPSGMVALSSLQRKMAALAPAPRNNYGGGARLP